MKLESWSTKTYWAAFAGSVAASQAIALAVAPHLGARGAALAPVVSVVVALCFAPRLESIVRGALFVRLGRVVSVDLCEPLEGAGQPEAELRFATAHPSWTSLALAFLALGISLVAEGAESRLMAAALAAGLLAAGATHVLRRGVASRITFHGVELFGGLACELVPWSEIERVQVDRRALAQSISWQVHLIGVDGQPIATIDADERRHDGVDAYIRCLRSRFA